MLSPSDLVSLFQNLGPTAEISHSKENVDSTSLLVKILDWDSNDMGSIPSSAIFHQGDLVGVSKCCSIFIMLRDTAIMYSVSHTTTLCHGRCSLLRGLGPQKRKVVRNIWTTAPRSHCSGSQHRKWMLKQAARTHLDLERGMEKKHFIWECQNVSFQ